MSRHSTTVPAMSRPSAANTTPARRYIPDAGGFTPCEYPAKCIFDTHGNSFGGSHFVAETNEDSNSCKINQDSNSCEPNQHTTLPESVYLPREVFLELLFKAQAFEQLVGEPSVAGSPYTPTPPKHPSPAASSPVEVSTPRVARNRKISGGSAIPNNLGSPATPSSLGSPSTPSFTGSTKISYRYAVSPMKPIPTFQPQGNPPPAAKKTVLIYPLPATLRIGDLIHSIMAPGGTQQIFYSSLPGQESHIAVITFATVFGAVAFKEYANEHGFFLSQRVARGSNPPDSDCEDGQDRLNGETRISVLHTLPEGRGIKKVILAKRHMADVKVRFWAEGGSVEKELLKWFRLHDGWFCDLDTEIAAGATRVLRIWATAEEVLNELQYIKLGYGKDEGGNGLEFVTYFPGINPKKDSPSTMLRFFSLREAVMAKRYFDILKGYEGKTNFTRDMTDRSCKNLSWHSYPKTGNRPADFEVNKTKSLDQEAEFEEGAGEGA